MVLKAGRRQRCALRSGSGRRCVESRVLRHAVPATGEGRKLIPGVGKGAKPLDVTMAYDPPKRHPTQRNRTP